MDDPLLVRRREALGDLQGVLDRLLLRQWPSRDDLRERLPLEQLRDHVGLAARLDELVDRQKVRVVEHPGRDGLVLEASEALWIANDRLGKDLDRDVAADAAVVGAVDLSHAANAEPRDDFVRA